MKHALLIVLAALLAGCFPVRAGVKILDAVEKEQSRQAYQTKQEVPVQSKPVTDDFSDYKEEVLSIYIKATEHIDTGLDFEGTSFKNPKTLYEFREAEEHLAAAVDVEVPKSCSQCRTANAQLRRLLQAHRQAIYWTEKDPYSYQLSSNIDKAVEAEENFLNAMGE